MLVGDSMNRNQFESLLCLLREGLPEKRRMYEVHGYRITKGRGYYIFKFEVAINFFFLITCMFNCESPDFLKFLAELCDRKEEMAWWLLCRQLIVHYKSEFIGLGMFYTSNIGVIAASYFCWKTSH